MRGAWIEIADPCHHGDEWESLPMRGAWIEIKWLACHLACLPVAPHAGSVD